MPAPDNCAQRPEAIHTGQASIRREAPQALTARGERVVGAAMLLLALLSCAGIMFIIFVWGEHPCYEVEGLTQRCNQDDIRRGAIQWFSAMGLAGLFIWSLRRLWKGF